MLSESAGLNRGMGAKASPRGGVLNPTKLSSSAMHCLVDHDGRQSHTVFQASYRKAMLRFWAVSVYCVALGKRWEPIVWLREKISWFLGTVDLTILFPKNSAWYYNLQLCGSARRMQAEAPPATNACSNQRKVPHPAHATGLDISSAYSIALQCS